MVKTRTAAVAAVALGLLLLALVLVSTTPEAVLPPLRALELGVRVRAYGEAYWLDRARRGSGLWSRARAYCLAHPQAPNCAAVLEARWIHDLQRSLHPSPSTRRDGTP